MHRAWLLLVFASCADSPTGSPKTPTRVVEAASFPAIEHRELDLLFLIDDSTSAHFELELAHAMPTLLSRLSMPDLPSIHIGVATSDLGTTGSLDPANPAPPVGTVGLGGCAGHGDAGRMTVSGAAVDGAFVIDDGVVRNYNTPLLDVLAYMMSVGSSGCGFEQTLAGIRAALDANEGFLRPDSSLAVIILTDEDDCSVRDAAAFLDNDETLLGPQQSFRCTREGVRCTEDLDTPGLKTNCETRRDTPYLDDPDLTRSALEAVRPARERLTVSAILGPPSPFEVRMVPINGQPQPALKGSCGINTPSGVNIAHPAPRIAEFIDGFASRGSAASICDPDYKLVLDRIAMPIQRSLGVACLDTMNLADTLDTPGLQPACEARDVTNDLARELPRCPAAGDCFDIVDDAMCVDRLRIVVDRKAPPAARTRVDVFCERAIDP